MQWDRLTLGRMAKELGFPRDTLESIALMVLRDDSKHITKK